MCSETKVRFLSWNVNKDSTKKDCEIKKIQDFLNPENNRIAILQEVNKKFYEDLKKDLKKDYQIYHGYKSKELGYAHCYTVIVTKTTTVNNLKIEKIESCGKDYLNKFVKIKIKIKDQELNILGLHAPDPHALQEWLYEQSDKKVIDLEFLKENLDKFFDDNNHLTKGSLKEGLNKYGFVPDIMIGDFNSGNYIKLKNDDGIAVDRENFQKVSTGYIDACQGKITRMDQGIGTQIDHILIKNDSSISFENVKVDEEVKYSDHYPIYCDIIWKAKQKDKTTTQES